MLGGTLIVFRGLSFEKTHNVFDLVTLKALGENDSRRKKCNYKEGSNKRAWELERRLGLLRFRLLRTAFRRRSARGHLDIRHNKTPFKNISYLFYTNSQSASIGIINCNNLGDKKGVK
jgi:hypothetical protein